jgi:hypothetical protein
MVHCGYPEMDPQRTCPSKLCLHAIPALETQQCADGRSLRHRLRRWHLPSVGHAENKRLVKDISLADLAVVDPVVASAFAPTELMGGDDVMFVCVMRLQGPRGPWRRCGGDVVSSISGDVLTV